MYSTFCIYFIFRDVERTRYYGVASSQIDWTSLVFLVAYIPLILPGAWIMDKWVSGS